MPGAASIVQSPSPAAGWQPPQKQSGNRLNLVVLVSDTFRADNLEAYGSQWVDTPALNRFAKDAIVFEQFYPEGMPTVPIRRQLYTGRRIAPVGSRGSYLMRMITSFIELGVRGPGALESGQDIRDVHNNIAYQVAVGRTEIKHLMHGRSTINGQLKKPEISGIDRAKNKSTKRGLSRNSGATYARRVS